MEKPARNPVLWLVIALPSIAVVAGLTSWYLASARGDRELPASYHWEGEGQDRDDARLAEAAHLGQSATVQVDAAAGRCSATLAQPAGAALQLDLTHPTDSHADRHVRLAREGDAGTRYGAACDALPSAHWWVQLADGEGHWLLRARAQGTLAEPLQLGAASP